MNDLTVCSVVFNDKKTNLFDLMVRSVIKFTRDKPYFIICDNGGNDLSKYKSDPHFTIVKGHSASSGSLQHGESLNKIFPLVKTKRTAIIESDCVLLTNGWDNIPKQYKMLATKKGNNLYHVCFMVFYTGVLKRNGLVDFRAGKDGNRTNRSYKSNEDVGWMINKKVSPNEICFMDFIDCKSGNGKYFNNRFQSDEFHHNGRCVVAHFGRGSNIKGKAIRNGFSHPLKQLEKWKERSEALLKINPDIFVRRVDLCHGRNYEQYNRTITVFSEFDDDWFGTYMCHLRGRIRASDINIEEVKCIDKHKATYNDYENIDVKSDNFFYVYFKKDHFENGNLSEFKKNALICYFAGL